LAAPLTAPGEAEELAIAGATEFYCGVQTRQWQDAFGDHDSISRRQGKANLESMEELKKVVQETKMLGLPLFMTVNEDYSKGQLPLALELAEEFEALGGYGIMVKDIALMSLLQKKGSKLMLGLSLLACTSSASALSFYFDLGVRRVVLPRFLSINQVKLILEKFPEVQGEALIFFDKCPFIDGYCRFIHSVGYQTAPPEIDSGSVCHEVFSHDVSYMLPACFELFGFPPVSPACAVCSLEALTGAGIQIFKVGGRGRSLKTLVKVLRFISAASKIPETNLRKELYRKCFGTACSKGACYYSGISDE
jgi:collagenase-like PrtC family protease